MDQLAIILISLFLVIIIAYIIFSAQGEEVSEEMKVTQTRLLKIKNKEYDLHVQKQTSNDKGLMQALLSDEEYSIAFIGKFLDKYNFIHSLKKALKQADIKIDVTQFILAVFVMSVILTGLMFIGPTGGNIFVAIPLGLIGAMVPALLIIKIKTGKRLNKFTAQLPDALSLIASSLRAGHSLPSAFAIVVNELPEPVSSIFRTACEDINLGRSTKEALDGMVHSMPGSIDLRFFITAVLIQREIGGNLAEILDNLNNTIRERFKLLGQLKAQTAQASLSGIVLALAPVFIGGVIYLLNPEYMEPLFNSTLGKAAIGIAVFLGVVGFLIIRKITNIRV